MVLYWWNIKESTEYKNKQSEIDSECKNADSENNKTENHKRHSKSWFRFFSDGKPTKVDVGVGDSIVDEEQEKKTFFKCLFRKVETTESDDLSKSPERLDIFVSSLQREVVVVQKEIIASSIASVLSMLISYPFDVIKTDFQTARYSKNIQDTFRNRRRIIYVIKHILVTKGIKRFYKGGYGKHTVLEVKLSVSQGHLASQRSSLFHTVSMFLTYYQVYHYIKDINQLKTYPSLVSFVAGFISASIPVMALYPYDIIRDRRYTKQQILKTHGPIVAAGVIREIEHFRPIFRGTFSLFLHMGTQYGLRFFFYEKIHDEMTLMRATREKATSTNPMVSAVDTINRLSNYQLLLAGGISAILGDLLAHPLDVIHSRICMPALIRQQFRFDQTCRRFCQCVITILKHEGIFGLYSGLISSMLKSTVSTAVQFAVHEKVKIWLQPFFPT